MAVSQTDSMGFCHTPSVSENYLKGYQLNPANSVGPFTVKIHIHHCLHADGSGGINPAEIAILKQGLDADFAEHNISFVYCESTHYEKSQEFSFADQEDPNTTVATLAVDDAINVFLYPDDFQYNDGVFPPSTVNGGGTAFSIPSTKLIVWGYVNYCIAPYAPQNQFGKHLATMPHLVAHELGHCLGLLHPHEPCTNNQLNCDECSDFICETNPSPPLYGSVNSNCQWVSTYFTPPCTGWGPPFTLSPDPAFNPNLDNIMAYSNYYFCNSIFIDAQGDRMRGFLANNPVLEPVIHHVMAPGDIVINTSEIWPLPSFPASGNVIINGDLIVKSGATLTIEKGNIQFPDGKSAIINKNGKIDNIAAKLTASCSVWEGVKVTGEPYTPQSPLTQGTYQGQSGSSIHHARYGIKVNWGGIVNCDNTLFQDNYYGVYFESNNEPQPLTYFNGCTFTSSYLSRLTEFSFAFPAFTTPRSHIVLQGVLLKRGEPIRHCTFTNGSNGTPLKTNFGIYALSSDVLVKDLNSFSQLDYGVYISGSKFDGSGVFNNVFENCHVGLYANKPIALDVTRNKFTMSGLPITYPSDYSQPSFLQFGAWIENKIPYLSFKSNTFFGKPNNSLIQVGSLAKNLGLENHSINDNYYKGLSIGNLANGNNGDDASGLLYLCNTNDPDTIQNYDFCVVSNASVATIQSVIDASSGFAKGAGNGFSYSNGNNGDNSDFYNSSPKTITYVWTNQGSIPNPEPLDVLNLQKVQSSGLPSCSRGRARCEEDCYTDFEITQIKRSIGELKQSNLQLTTQYEQAMLGYDSLMMRAFFYKKIGVIDSTDYLITTILADELKGLNRVDSISKYLTMFDRVETDLFSVEYLVSHNKNRVADSLLLELDGKYPLTADEMLDIEQHRAIIAEIGIKDYWALDHLTLGNLEQMISNDHSMGTAWIKDILTGYGKWYPPHAQLPEMVQERAIPKQKELGSTLKTYPNPANNTVSVVLPIGIEFGNIKIYDQLGTCVLQHLIVTGDSKSQVLDVSGITSGIYFLQAEGKENVVKTKLVILK